MKHSFGKTIGTAARIFAGKVLAELYLPEGQEAIGRRALRIGSSKLPVKVTIQSSIKKVKALSEEELMQNKAEESKYAVKDAREEIERAKVALNKAESEEEKKIATEKLANAEKTLATSIHIQEIEEGNLETYEEEHKED